jgi:hypothetical protein
VRPVLAPAFPDQGLTVEAVIMTDAIATGDRRCVARFVIKEL